MNIPGFTADDSLSKSSGHYQTGRHLVNTISPIYPAAMGQDFPDQKCTCKGCGTGGGDVTGQCGSVCKDKTVYDKGSESYDYCKAKAIQRPKFFFRGNLGNLVAFRA